MEALVHLTFLLEQLRKPLFAVYFRGFKIAFATRLFKMQLKGRSLVHKEFSKQELWFVKEARRKSEHIPRH
jgi:hypothetical protein